MSPFQPNKFALVLIGMLLWQSGDACQMHRISALLQDPALQMNKHDFTFRGRVMTIDQIKMPSAEYEVLVREVGEESAEVLRKSKERMSVLTFKVDRVWKGQVSENFVAFYTDAPCAMFPALGERYIVFGSIDVDDKIHAWGFVPERGFAKVEYKLDRGY